MLHLRSAPLKKIMLFVLLFLMFCRQSSFALPMILFFTSCLSANQVQTRWTLKPSDETVPLLDFNPGLLLKVYTKASPCTASSGDGGSLYKMLINHGG